MLVFFGSVLMVPLSWDFRCTFRFPFWLKDLLHKWHEYGFSPVWINLWRRNDLLCLKRIPHSLMKKNCQFYSFFLSISPLFWDLLYFVYTTFVRYKKYHKLRVKLLQRLIEEYCKHHNWGFPPISILIFKIGPPLPTYFTLS